MTAAESPLLSVAGLQVRFGDDAPAVRQVDLTVRHRSDRSDRRRIGFG